MSTGTVNPPGWDEISAQISRQFSPEALRAAAAEAGKHKTYGGVCGAEVSAWLLRLAEQREAEIVNG